MIWKNSNDVCVITTVAKENAILRDFEMSGSINYGRCHHRKSDVITKAPRKPSSLIEEDDTLPALAVPCHSASLLLVSLIFARYRTLSIRKCSHFEETIHIGAWNLRSRNARTSLNGTHSLKLIHIAEARLKNQGELVTDQEHMCRAYYSEATSVSSDGKTLRI